MPHSTGSGQPVWGSPFDQPGDDSDERPSLPDIGVDRDDPLFPHVVHALAALIRAGFDPTDPELIARAKEVGRRRHANRSALPVIPTSPPEHVPTRKAILRQESRDRSRKARTAAKQRPVSERQCVYYMRIGDRCKIGYTTDLRGRVSAIYPEELLAAEPGPMALERQRHREFGALRTHGEWFRLEEPLVGHINRLIEAGNPEVDEIAQALKRARKRAPAGSVLRS